MSKLLQLLDSKLLATQLVIHQPYVLVFKTTHYCWYNCAHCCENSGPHQPRQYIPQTIICDYLAQAKSDTAFSNEVVFTGGEIFSAYRFGPENYVPDLLNFSLDNNIGTDIKTNAGWARTSFGRDVFSDIGRIISAHKPYAMQISLSLDKYHTNAVDNCVRVISKIASIKNNKTMIHVSSFDDANSLQSQMFAKLRNNRVRIDDAIIGTTQNMRPVKLLNNGLLLNCSNATLRAAGRGTQLPNAASDPFNQFSFMTGDGYILVAFDSFGNVTLGENGPKKITVPWRDGTGTPRPLADIRRDLVRATRKMELQSIIFYGWRPNVR